MGRSWEMRGVDFGVDTQCCLIEKILAGGESLGFPFMKNGFKGVFQGSDFGASFLFSHLLTFLCLSGLQAYLSFHGHSY